MKSITFSTLVCRNWQIETAIAKVIEYGCDGIEWRGGPQARVDELRHIAIEPHDDFVRSTDIAPVFKHSNAHPALQLTRDIDNAFAVGEDPDERSILLKDRLADAQVKDGKGGCVPNWRLCPLGQGDVPLNQAFELLLTNDYQGAFSVEWEYAWHPELHPPEATAQRESA